MQKRKVFVEEVGEVDAMVVVPGKVYRGIDGGVSGELILFDPTDRKFRFSDELQEKYKVLLYRRINLAMAQLNVLMGVRHDGPDVEFESDYDALLCLCPEGRFDEVDEVEHGPNCILWAEPLSYEVSK